MKEAKIKGTVSLNTARMGQMKRSLLSIALASMGLGLGVAGHAQNLNLQSTARVQNSQEDKFALNFVNADIDAVVRAIGSFTNQTFVVDPRVRGTISLVSPQPLSAADAKNALLAALRLQGFTIVESGGIARVLPENDAKVQADSVDPRKAMNQSGNAIVTQVFQLNYESATALVPVLRPLIAPNNTIAAYPNNNTLVITDYADNLQRIARIIASIDGPYSGDLEVVPLEHALAVDLAAILGRMLDGRPAHQLAVAAYAEQSPTESGKGPDCKTGPTHQATRKCVGGIPEKCGGGQAGQNIAGSIEQQPDFRQQQFFRLEFIVWRRGGWFG